MGQTNRIVQKWALSDNPSSNGLKIEPFNQIERIQNTQTILIKTEIEAVLNSFSLCRPTRFLHPFRERVLKHVLAVEVPQTYEPSGLQTLDSAYGTFALNPAEGTV